MENSTKYHEQFTSRLKSAIAFSLRETTGHVSDETANLMFDRVLAVVDHCYPVPSDDAEASFTEYFVRNYPGPDTVIFDPKWHAPKILRAAASALAPNTASQKDAFETYFERQVAWSRETFGPSLRTKGVINHIRKELLEIEADPFDLAEWLDVAALAMDGYWRHGGKVSDIVNAFISKQNKNLVRKWPDYRTLTEDDAVEHDRSQADAEGGAA